MRAVQNRMTVRNDEKVYVRIQKGWDTSVDIDKEFIEDLGFEVQNVYKHTAGCWVDFAQIQELNALIPEGMLMRPENLFSAEHEGITKTNAAEYQINGALGQGVDIAVIDIGYGALASAQSAGTAPASPTLVDLTASGQPFASGTNHGTGCTEIIFEYATQANYTLYKITGISQLGLAVASAIASGVDLISSSLSYYNTGWADGTGLACAAAATGRSDRGGRG